MKSTRKPGSENFPDGLDENAIDRLIAEVSRDVSGAVEPTSALLDGSAAERRRRRIERRALTGVVRSLPARSSLTRGIEDLAS